MRALDLAAGVQTVAMMAADPAAREINFGAAKGGLLEMDEALKVWVARKQEARNVCLDDFCGAERQLAMGGAFSHSLSGAFS